MLVQVWDTAMHPLLQTANEVPPYVMVGHSYGGVISLLYGFLMILAPLLGAVVLTWWLGAYSIVFGVALIVLAFRLRSQRERDAVFGSPKPAT